MSAESAAAGKTSDEEIGCLSMELDPSQKPGADEFVLVKRSELEALLEEVRALKSALTPSSPASAPETSRA